MASINCEKSQQFTEKTPDSDSPQVSETEKANKYKLHIYWSNVIIFAVMHYGALVGLKECFVSAKLETLIFAYILYVLGSIGVIAGAHRLWSHRSYKAKTPLKILLVCMQSISYQDSCYVWARDHRVHHKFVDSDADPHNSNRGFFFSHIGWLLCRKHPDVIMQGKKIDLSDLLNDKVCMFQHNHYLKTVALFCFIIPTLVPYLFWNESLYNAFLICGLTRFAYTLHSICIINSVSHMFGRRPYDKGINPTENRWVSFFAAGEGFHNYHHTFSWDYAASEMGYDLNISKLFIDFFALFGWAYDRKVASPQMIVQRKLRTGDIHEHGPYGIHNEK